MLTIEDVIRDAGGAPAVAERLEINPVSVYEWVENNRLPPKRVIQVAELTGWMHTPHQIDPILYPNPTDGIPPGVIAEGRFTNPTP